VARSAREEINKMFKAQNFPLELIGTEGYWFLVFDDENPDHFDKVHVKIFKISDQPIVKWYDMGLEFWGACMARRGWIQWVRND
jgi:hypothetical protein